MGVLLKEFVERLWMLEPQPVSDLRSGHGGLVQPAFCLFDQYQVNMLLGRSAGKCL